MDSQEFKLEFLNRNQMLNIIELYQLPVGKTLSTKKMLDEIKKYVKIDDNGEIVFINGSPLEGGRTPKGKDPRGVRTGFSEPGSKLDSSNPGRKKLGVNIKVF